MRLGAPHHLVALLLASSAAACALVDDSRPPSLVSLRDSIVVNGPAPVRFQVDLRDASGAALPLQGLAARADYESIALISDSTFTCVQRGDTRISIAVGASEANFVARCRPVVAFWGQDPIELELDGPARPIEVQAIGAHGRRETTLNFVASTTDTAIVEIQQGSVRGRAVGRARLIIDFGDIQTALPAVVFERIAAGTVSLAPGEFRRWDLVPGRYAVTVDDERDGAARSPLEMVTDGLRCQRTSSDERSINCVVSARGSVVLVHQGSGARGRAASAFVWITRVE